MEESMGASGAGTLNAAYHASFVLRCWTDAGGTVRLRVIDARSGLNYPLPSLLDLPALIDRLVHRSVSADGHPERQVCLGRGTGELEDAAEELPQ
jgi:hypothetical protein